MIQTQVQESCTLDHINFVYCVYGHDVLLLLLKTYDGLNSVEMTMRSARPRRGDTS